MKKLLRISLLIAGILITISSSSAAPAALQQNSPQSEHEELREILVQARDALITVAAKDPASVNGSISEDIGKVVEYFLYIGDTEDARYLQHHLKKPYGDEVARALEPTATIREDESLRTASQLSTSDARMNAYGNVAAKQYSSGDRTGAESTFELAIKAALEPKDQSSIYTDRPITKLFRLANLLQDNGYREAANKTLSQAKQLLDSSSDNEWDWKSLAQTAISLHDLNLARQTLEKVGDEQGRPELEQDIQAASTDDENPDAAIRIAMGLNDFELRVKTLRTIGERQISAGDLRAAASTLQLAEDVALEEPDDTFQVFQLNDIAWDQIKAGDRDTAERTLEIALKANEKHRWGSDQVSGWCVLADTFAYLGYFDRAREIATKSEYPDWRARALNVVAYRQTWAQSAEALEWVKTLKTPEERAGAFLGVAEGIIEQMKGLQ